MGRIRTIKPEFPQSESMGRVSRDARLCFILLWTLVDDCGRTRASSRLLASLLYPYDDDAGSLIDGWLDELEREKVLFRYEIEGNCYLEICKWLTHQKIDHASASRLPPPREDSRILDNPSVVSRIKEGIKEQGLVPSTLDHSAADAAALTLSEPEPKLKKGKTSQEFILPDWVPNELWDIWVENRKAIKKPLNTVHAKNIAIGRLEKFRAEGYDISSVLNEAILKNWVGLFTSKDTLKIPKPKIERRALTDEEAEAQWEKDFSQAGISKDA